MRVRVARPEDAPFLADLYRLAVSVTGARRYSPAQVRVWLSLAPTTDRLEALMGDGRRRWVATDEAETPVAFADLTPGGMVHFLYAHPDAPGAAGAVYEALEAHARLVGMVTLTAEASDLARGFFLRRGWIDRGRRDFEIDGVAIHNHAVEKAL